MDEEIIDEAAAESFPASDAPAWTTAHVGGPSPRPWALEQSRELRASLRADLDRLVRARDRSESSRADAAEEVVSRSMLGAGRAVIREPVDDARRVHNVEAELLGADRGAPVVVLGARHGSDDPSGVAMELAVLRELARERLRRPVRFVAFARGGEERYADRLRRERTPVHAILFLARLDLPRARDQNRVLFLANIGSGPTARAARDAFRASSRIPARALALPSWFPGLRSFEQASFWRRRWPAAIATERAPWLAPRRDPGVPDLDRMAAAVPGFVAAVARLAGGRA
jgi:hypothetical protein